LAEVIKYQSSFVRRFMTNT